MKRAYLILGIVFSALAISVGAQEPGTPILPIAAAAQKSRACSSASFSGPVPFYSSVRPVSIAAADFNRDGSLDLAVAGFEASGGPSFDVRIFLGSGRGRFTFSGSFPATFPEGIAVGDMNRDGILDLVVSSPGPGIASFLPGDGAGNFGAPNILVSTAELGPDFGPGKAVVEDFIAKDARLDVFFPSQSGIAVTLGGNGDGTFFGPAVTPIGLRPFLAAAGDFNRDGHLDFAVALNHSHAVGVLLGDSGGGFFSYTEFPTGGMFAQAVVVGDFNRDGIHDIAATNSSDHASGINGSVGILLGDGMGGFAPPKVIDGVEANDVNDGSPPALQVMVGADFNHDGKLDLAVSERAKNAVVILVGDGTGNFSPSRRFHVGEAPVTLTVGDFNHDGDADLVVGSFTKNAFHVLFNTCSH